MKKVLVVASIALMAFCFSTVNAQEVKKSEPKKVEAKSTCCSKDADAKKADCAKDSKKCCAETAKKSSCCPSDKNVEAKKACSKECSHKEAAKAGKTVK